MNTASNLGYPKILLVGGPAACDPTKYKNVVRIGSDYIALTSSASNLNLSDYGRIVFWPAPDTFSIPHSRAGLTTAQNKELDLITAKYRVKSSKNDKLLASASVRRVNEYQPALRNVCHKLLYDIVRAVTFSPTHVVVVVPKESRLWQGSHDHYFGWFSQYLNAYKRSDNLLYPSAVAEPQNSTFLLYKEIRETIGAWPFTFDDEHYSYANSLWNERANHPLYDNPLWGNHTWAWHRYKKNVDVTDPEKDPYRRDIHEKGEKALIDENPRDRYLSRIVSVERVMQNSRSEAKAVLFMTENGGIVVCPEPSSLESLINVLSRNPGDKEAVFVQPNSLGSESTLRKELPKSDTYKKFIRGVNTPEKIADVLDAAGTLEDVLQHLTGINSIESLEHKLRMWKKKEREWEDRAGGPLYLNDFCCESLKRIRELRSTESGR